ncbi:MAG: DNA replication/repair protein RecF, partial [Parvibaculales bacterium]
AIGVGCAPHSNSKQLRINGTKLALRELGGVLPMLWLTPAHDRLFLEGASGRRRFLDRFGMALFAEYSLYLAAYERAMRERNRLLALGEGEKWVNAVEGEMAVNGVHLAELRLSAFERLSEEAMRDDVGNFPPLDMKLHGEWEMVVKEKSHEEAQGLFSRSLCEGRGLDAKAGRALSGPHRSDVHVHHIAKNMPAPLCSTGEQKALLLSLFLAKARICKASSGKSALLLLDEISAHLDTPHRKALFGELAKIGGQVWMSGTHESLFEHCPKKQLFHLPQSESKP